MNLRRLYVTDLISEYQTMLYMLDNGTVGQGKILKSVKDVCEIFNNLVDYIAHEYPEYILQEWDAKNAKEFRDNLEKMDHKIMGTSVNGGFFGVIRDVANTTKHMKIKRDKAQVKFTADIRESMAKIRFEDEHGYYYSHISMVVASHQNGSEIPLEIYLYLCFLSFSSILEDVNLITKKPTILERRDFYKTREQVNSDMKKTIEVTVGEPVNLKLSSFIYQEHIFSNLRGAKEEETFDRTFDVDFISTKGLF